MSKEKLTRHEMREAALMILFQKRFNDDIPLEEILTDSEESFELLYNNDSLKIVNGVTEHDTELCEIISRYSPSRKIDRISAINLVILKIALYEMMYCPSVPKKAAMNEAIELSKEYAVKSDSSFINGVLSAYYKENSDA